MEFPVCHDQSIPLGGCVVENSGRAAIRGCAVRHEWKSGPRLLGHERPERIIRDHNDVFNSSAIELFTALFKICRPTIQKPPAQKSIAVPATIAEAAPAPGPVAQR